jgi:acyl-coenzyme A synthetase/AMP-(fatty) acid ligase
VAVIGVPDEEMGEAVKAVVQLADGAASTDELAAELIDYARDRLAHYKCPASVGFVAQLPRTPTGKLRKHVLRREYWPEAAR